MEEESARCPFLVPVLADYLWVFPVSGYCRRDRVRVPGSETFARFCTTSDYAMCPGYQASMPRVESLGS